ncbi:MAG: TFIIB-type zinc ribbon-containing protein [Nitrosarchaeum sp.]
MLNENKFLIRHHNYCPSCGKNQVIMDEKIGELCCTLCGFVISENMVDAGAEWRSFSEDVRNRTRVGDRTSILIHDMGLSTMIGRTNQDVTGKPISRTMKNSFNRLRLENSRTQIRSSSDKNFVQAFSDMNNMKIKLALSDSIIETAAYRYRKAVEKGLIRGRSIQGMVGACIYFACRDAEISRSLNDIAKAINLPKKTLSKSYRSLLKEFEIIVPPPNPINSVSKIANIVGLSEKTKRKAVEFLENEKTLGGLEGRDPNGLAGAVLYVIGVVHGEVKSQKQIALASGVTEVTIRNRIKGLNKSFLREYTG